MSRSQTLSRWFQQSVATSDAASNGILVALTFLQVLKDIALIAAYWGFAGIVSQWVIDGHSASRTMLWLTAMGLVVVWISTGLAIFLNHHKRLQLSAVLQQRLMATFFHQQHALLRQHSTFYWQTLWQMHIPAVVNWHFDYRVQQMVAVVVPLIALVAIFIVNLVVGASLLITLPIVPLFMVLVGKGAASLHRKHFIALERLGRLFVDRLSALPLLTMFQAHDAQQQLLDKAGRRLRDRTMKVVSIAFLSTTVLDFFSTLAVALIAVYIGFTLLGEFDLGEAINLQQGLWLLLTAPLLLAEMKKLGQFYHQKAQAEAAKDALQDLLSEAGASSASQGRPLQTLSLSGPLTYAPDLQTKGITLTRGDKILLSGPSGAGKTVLMEYLCGQRAGLQNPLEDYALLTQTPVVLPCSVKDNLTLGGHYTDENLHQVLNAVGLADWVAALPQDIHTLMGEHPPLSGGQGQRLAIARVLLRQPQVWLLDEPTAHLPAQQHDEISALIQQASHDATVIWASHKPLSQDWFTQHWVVKDGGITC
ncbi:ATP-binding cassette domain-containing protein [Alteromonas sp. C1M14]|uniref:ABC transporter ATP-binding protein/permease n=1 Tax=Alteromonas sp. C1M14 TaxID=2841567 RepID=UPI001C08A8D5|nr:ATP-binding cassette domain-containing protein [Alteromonas sp. C1M14]MBU2978108.1 ATP-binding cassette domain-containing protein [Alteromonas sp. C1M14]